MKCNCGQCSNQVQPTIRLRLSRAGWYKACERIPMRLVDVATIYPGRPYEYLSVVILRLAHQLHHDAYRTYLGNEGLHDFYNFLDVQKDRKRASARLEPGRMPAHTTVETKGQQNHERNTSQ